MKAKIVFNKIKLYMGILLALGSALLLSACGETLPLTSTSFVDAVAWNSSSNSLEASGHLRGDGSVVKVSNADNAELLGSTLVTNQHYWKLKVTGPETVPCAVVIEGAGKSEQVEVQNAPADCNTAKVGSRAIVQTLGATAAAPVRPVAATLPDGVITSPVSDVTVTAGSAVIFRASANSQATTGTVKYLWNFDGGVPNSTAQNPGAITFKNVGVYRVSLTATDDNGSDPIPAVRTITVTPNPASRIQAAPPIANIDTPAGPQTILVGESLFFSGSGFDPAGSGPLTFSWNFDGAAPNNMQQVPGIITFTQPGVFNVSLSVTDSSGNRNIIPATVPITVMNLLDANLPPTGNIRGPSMDITITTGTSVFFQGDGSDPDGNMPLTYYWSFGGAAADSVLQNPGLVTFNVPGVYVVTLFVIDSLGLADPNPPMRIITVNDTGVSNNDFPEGAILSPATDMEVIAGDTVVFEGEGFSPSGNDPLTYLWTFGHPDIGDSMEASPGPMIFDVPGVYEITFTVTDSLGQADPTPDMRTITVVDPAAPPGGAQIEGEIISPRKNITVEVGTPIDFEGKADDLAPDAAAFFYWNFGDPAIPDSMEQNPMGIVYGMAGEYIVTLIVGDDLGNIDPNPPTRTITVVDAGGTGSDTDPPPVDPTNPPADPTPPPASNAAAPTGYILSPAGDVTIVVGDAIELAGAGEDPNGSPLTFRWDIDGAGGISDITEQNPGSVAFTEIGIWEVELHVTNAEGITDPNPPSITVTVEPGDADPPPP